MMTVDELYGEMKEARKQGLGHVQVVATQGMGETGITGIGTRYTSSMPRASYDKWHPTVEVRRVIVELAL